VTFVNYFLTGFAAGFAGAAGFFTGAAIVNSLPVNVLPLSKN